jgi:hypothetical protein
VLACPVGKAVALWLAFEVVWIWNDKVGVIVTLCAPSSVWTVTAIVWMALEVTETEVVTTVDSVPVRLALAAIGTVHVGPVRVLDTS